MIITSGHKWITIDGIMVTIMALTPIVTIGVNAANVAVVDFLNENRVMSGFF